MAPINDFFPDEPLTIFHITKVTNQLYPEIEPARLSYQFERLEKKWHIGNESAYFLPLVFNKDYYHPLITKGWKDFQIANNLPDDVEIQVGCYGPRFFKLIAHKAITNCSEIMPWHSRSQKTAETMFFDIMLHDENTATPQLHVPACFSEFLRDNLLYWLTLCGDNGIYKDITVLNYNDPLNTLLGDSWRDFSISQKFAVGDVIRFKFDQTRITGKCHVYKIVF